MAIWPTRTIGSAKPTSTPGQRSAGKNSFRSTRKPGSNTSWTSRNSARRFANSSTPQRTPFPEKTPHRPNPESEVPNSECRIFKGTHPGGFCKRVRKRLKTKDESAKKSDKREKECARKRKCGTYRRDAQNAEGRKSWMGIA